MNKLLVLIFGAFIIEAVVEIIGDYLPDKYSTAGARTLAIIMGLTAAFAFNISLVESLNNILSFESVVGTVFAGLIMSRSAEWIHALLNIIINLPYVINNNKQTKLIQALTKINSQNQ